MLLKRLFIFSTFLFFVSCGFNSNCETSFVYYWQEKTFINASILKMRDDLSFENGMIKAYVDNETGSGAMPNLSIGNLGCTSIAKGIDIDLYLNNLDAVGVHWFDTPMGAVEHYRIYYTKSGYFKIDYIDKNRNYKSFKSVSPLLSNVNPNTFNNLKMKTCDSGNIEFYMNKKLILTVKRDELKLYVARFFIAYRTENKKVYSKENPGIACFKINSEQFFMY